jgi:hypothetical protein
MEHAAGQVMGQGETVLVHTRCGLGAYPLSGFSLYEGLDYDARLGPPTNV